MALYIIGLLYFNIIYKKNYKIYFKLARALK